MIAIIGNGNVATHLYEALKDKTEVCKINSRSFEGFPKNPDLILISVSDDAIKEVLENLPANNAIIAHTSGSVPMSILEREGQETGVLYPLQTFTKGAPLNYKEIPVFVEGSSPDTVKKLEEVASLFSEDIRQADSEARKKLHLASVFACNFTNALASISEKMLQDSGIDFSALLPLMKQTVNKLETLSPERAQTGPASRGDIKTMEKHLKMLDGNPQLQQVYSLLSEVIINAKHQ